MRTCLPCNTFTRLRLWRVADNALSYIGFIAVWESLARFGIFNANLLPPPSVLTITAWTLVGSGVLFVNAIGSLARILVGFMIAMFLGGGSGVVLGAFPAVGRRVVPILDLLRPIPPIAWIPLAILWFGLGNRPAVFIVSVGASFPIFLNTYHGIRLISKAHVNAARCLGAGRLLIITDVLLPAALPQILTGLRVGVGIAWTSVIAAEMVGTHTGLGYAIQLNRTMLKTEEVVVNMIVIGLIGWAMNTVIGRLEQRLMYWNLETLRVDQAEE